MLRLKRPAYRLFLVNYESHIQNALDKSNICFASNSSPRICIGTLTRVSHDISRGYTKRYFSSLGSKSNDYNAAKYNGKAREVNYTKLDDQHRENSEREERLRNLLSQVGISKCTIKDSASVSAASSSSSLVSKKKKRRRRKIKEPMKENSAAFWNTFLKKNSTRNHVILQQLLRHKEEQDAVLSAFTSPWATPSVGESTSALNTPIHERLGVKSVHAAQIIDIGSVANSTFTIKYPKTFAKNSLIIKLSADRHPSDSSEFNTTTDYFHHTGKPRYVVVFQFGSVVFFNVDNDTTEKILEEIKVYSTDPVAPGNEKRDSFEVAIVLPSESINTHSHEASARSTSDNITNNNGPTSNNFLSPASHSLKPFTPKVNSDYATVNSLNTDSISIVSTVMAQTVALDAQEQAVDSLLSTFATINKTIKQEATITNTQRETLFKIVAQINAASMDVISKLGIKDRSDTAWNLSKYVHIHEGMREEFELDTRLDRVQHKLNLVQKNAQFYLEVFQHQKSNTLEWVIVFLITFECILMISEMSGFGQHLFSYANFFQGDATSNDTIESLHSIQTQKDGEANG